MMDTNGADPLILGYATPTRKSRFAVLPVGVIILVALILPGLSSALIRGSAWRCIFLILTILVAFLIFGPLWGEVLFRSTQYDNTGLYPFIATCAGVEVVSVVWAINDRKRAIDSI
jgi:uncharacterized membrane protein